MSSKGEEKEWGGEEESLSTTWIWKVAPSGRSYKVQTGSCSPTRSDYRAHAFIMWVQQFRNLSRAELWKIDVNDTTNTSAGMWQVTLKITCCLQGLSCPSWGSSLLCGTTDTCCYKMLYIIPWNIFSRNDISAPWDSTLWSWHDTQILLETKMYWCLRLMGLQGGVGRKQRSRLFFFPHLCTNAFPPYRLFPLCFLATALWPVSLFNGDLLLCKDVWRQKLKHL